ncbi:amidohydrolase [Jatrophihabitans telluris]|uniref:Amidohydrolase n=1 Tax=Jatrophihabitans telluris TaxID=2038343 RepID=A0ABY4QWQ0_9ACTN|nr:amidohydrolase [Jatrophihabitans telluris]UQX87793.1 amidohydrolase [Jatrophihabitans telluris]
MQPVAELASKWLATHADDLVDWRRDLHRHPEVAYTEHRTTELIMTTLRGFGLNPSRLAVGTGVVCDIGDGPTFTALRADIDALPLPDHKIVPYASQVPGVCHACGHDAHTAILLGVAGVLAGAATTWPGSVRLIFQPAEERMPGGAMAVVDAGALTGVEKIFAVHCDPKLDAGKVGLRVGAITAAFDQIEVRLSGPGGHTARPQLTVDLVYALGLLITELPGLLSRRVDPRSALSLVWGTVSAGSAANAIPQSGSMRGTLRMLDGHLWERLQPLVTQLAADIVAPTGAKVEVHYERGVPAVVNDPSLVALQTQAALAALGSHGVSDTAQSMGGEDFAWYLRTVAGSMARLGVRVPGTEGGDLHQPSFDIDESALAVGVRFTAAILDELWNPQD